LVDSIRQEKDIKKIRSYIENSKGLDGYERLEFLGLDRMYELKEGEIKEKLNSLQNPRRWIWITSISQVEEDEKISLQQLLNIVQEERRSLREGERAKRERRIRSNLVRETLAIIRKAKTKESEKHEEAARLAIDIVALARIKNERMKNVREHLGDSQVPSPDQMKKLSEADSELRTAEKGLTSLGVTLESEKERINERKEFYKDTGVDEKLKEKSQDFSSKFQSFQAAKQKVAAIERVRSKTAEIDDTYREEMKKIENACSYIDGLLLSDEEKEVYKKDALNPALDLEEVLKNAKSSARENQKRKIEEALAPLNLDSKHLSKAIERLSDDGANCDEVISETREAYVEGIKKVLRAFVTLNDEEKDTFISRLLPDGSNGAEIIEEAKRLGKSHVAKIIEAIERIDKTGLSEARKSELKSEINRDGSNAKEIAEKAERENENRSKRITVVKEGDIIYVTSDNKIKREIIILGEDEIRGIVVKGREVFLYEYEKKEGEIEIRGYGDFGLLPELKKGNEITLARLYDRVLARRGSKGGVREEKTSRLFEKIGHLSVKEAYGLIRKEVRGMSLIPNIVMSVGSEEERKYVYKNIGEREEGKKNKVWIEGINEIKNYGEDERSIGKYSDSKVGAIVGYGKEVGEGKYVGMYMKGSKHEIKQGAGNSGEVVNVGFGLSGGYENKVEIKWLTYVGMSKYRAEREWEEGKAKGEFSGGEIGLAVEGGVKLGIVKPYIGIGARKNSYEDIEEKGNLIDVEIEKGSYERCVGRIGIEGNREISKKVEIVGRVEYERVTKGERGSEVGRNRG
jgi:hypothetical protein